MKPGASEMNVNVRTQQQQTCVWMETLCCRLKGVQFLLRKLSPVWMTELDVSHLPRFPESTLHS